ncbi:MFS transporter [Peristeroidobacter agariperforans]|uniref:MFS transporter n=1 Tax=Peristeroidobacter agariperforans TaxID=268404 RepID=UPI00101B9CE4|nr:MFS transporter [Peristeroidobacter agariperforans]
MTSLSAQTQSVLRHPNVLRFIGGRFLASLGAQIQVVAVGWQMYDITGDPLDLGLIGLSQFIPFVTLILPAGHAADNYNRARIVTTCYLTSSMCALALLIMTLRGLLSAWPIFLIMMALGASRAFSMPASQSVLPNLVPADAFRRAVALNSSSQQVATIIGPAVGGVLYLAGPSVVYATVMTLALTAALLMFQVRGASQPVSTTREPLSLETLLSGLKFVRSRPVVLGAISLDLFAVMLGGATALMPMFASDILHVGPTGLGLLRTAPGIGAAACGLVLALSPISRHVGSWMFGGVAMFGVATIVFGLSTSFYVSMAALVVLGAADMVSVYVRHLLVQLDTPDYIRGRVSAVSSVFIGASNELGDFESGVMARWWGAVRAVLIGGVATLVVTGLWTRLFPVLWKMQEFPQQQKK